MSDWMGVAIAFATRVAPVAYPNPGVAVLLVLEDKEICRASNTEQPGHHAEHVALQKALEMGIDPAACALYTNLEPCSERMGVNSCTDLLLKSGIRDVHIAMKDPYFRVNGQGIDRLIDEGVSVSVGEHGAEAIWANSRYFERFCPHCGWVLKD